MDEQALYRAFLVALPDRMVGLEMAYEEWLLSRREAALEQLYRLSHNLSGAAALYGFEQVGAPCRALECYLHALLREGWGDDGSDFDSVASLLVSVRGVVRLVVQESLWQANGKRG